MSMWSLSGKKIIPIKNLLCSFVGGRSVHKMNQTAEVTVYEMSLIFHCMIKSLTDAENG